MSTLIPENPAGFRSHNANEIEPINAMIRDLAASQNAVLVDSYAAFGGHLEYLDGDGLHPPRWATRSSLRRSLRRFRHISRRRLHRP